LHEFDAVERIVSFHLLLDEQGDQIFAVADEIAERLRKIGGTTLRSIGHIGRLQRIGDNNADYVASLDMLTELCDYNRQLAAAFCEARRAPACWRLGSTRRSAAPGSSTRRLAGPRVRPSIEGAGGGCPASPCSPPAQARG
jgi:hypothetical protein